MNRSFWILIAALLVFTSLDVSGQRWKLRRYELDLYAAGVAFHGDIGRADRPLANMVNGFRPSFGVTPRFMVRQDLAVGLDLAYLMYGGKDVDNEHGNFRDLRFTSHAFQHFVRVEYYLLGVERARAGSIYNRRGMVNNFGRIQVYVFGGAGGILVNAKVLQEDGSEPVENPGYFPGTHYTAGFPVGGGIKLPLDPRWSFGVEVGYQFTLSDYLDGYKSEWSDYNDSYYLVNVKGIMRIRNDRNGRPLFSKYYR